MRLWALGPIFLLYSVTLYALDQKSQRGSQSDAHQMFFLRDTVTRHHQSSYFLSGKVACAFNDTATCEKKFKSVLAAGATPLVAKEIHHILAYAALRNGRYRRALLEMDALLAIDPSDGDAIDTRPFVEALSHFPDQIVQVDSANKATVQMDDHKLPVLINGKKAYYFFDTGANLSTLTESDALRLGMEIQDVKSGGGGDVNGSKVLFRIALAKSLALGGIVLNNVAFLVASNQQQPFVEMEPGQRGLIGLPVLRAFGSIKWSREGIFEADRSSKPANTAAANLCFNDLHLVTTASFDKHTLPFTLDTGAETTDLWPKFADVAADLIRKSGSNEVHPVIGVGGEQKFEATSIPKVTLQLGGKSVSLQPAHVLKTQQQSISQWYYGNLGNDLLGQAHNVSIDFRTMTLGLDTGGPAPIK